MMPEQGRPSQKEPEGEENLRQRAEDAVVGQNRDSNDVPLEQLQELMHELEVHQVELEIQNESLRAAQTELEHSRDRYADLYDFAPVGYITLNIDGIISESNLTAAAMLGMERGRLLGHPLVAYIHHHGKNRFVEHLRRCARAPEGEELVSEVTLQKAAGLPRTGPPKLLSVQLRTAVVVEPQNDRRSYRTALVDLTELRRTQQEQRQAEENFAELADNMLQLAWMADEAGFIFWYNRRWFEFTGSTQEEMEHSGWRCVLHPEHRARVREKLRRHIESGEEWEDTFPLHGSDGSYRSFLARATPILDPQGNVIRWFGTHTDITERLEMEEKLREADRRKDEFLATLAHELRNPLAPIRTGLELLRMAPGEAELSRDVFEILETQSSQLVRLVDDLLDVSRISRGIVELRKAPLSLAAVLENAVKSARPIIDAGGQSVELRLPDQSLIVDADAVRLSLVFSNLITNSLKYTRGPGRITVDVASRGETVEIRVRDQGIGIAPDMLERIFAIFVHGESHLEHSKGGLGSGLTLCRSLVDLHGGSIRAFSEGGGRGSEFVVTLPLLNSQAEMPVAVTPRPRSTSQPSPRRILVVDDNRSTADMLGRLLAAAGHQVQVAYSGAAGLAAGDDFQPHLVLLDLGMPEMSGYETARAIRRRPWGKSAFLVALTGWGQEKDRQRTSDCGFDGHLVKPVESSALERLIASELTPSR